MSVSRTYSIAVLDDYQEIAMQMADWSIFEGRASVSVFKDHLTDQDALVERLSPFDVICVMRERTPLTRAIIERLPNLKLIASTGRRNASIDTTAAAERGIEIAITGYSSTAAIELTWALLLASAKNIVQENTALKNGEWQQSIGEDLSGKTLGVIGLGNIGSKVARVANAFDMNVIAWSQNLTSEAAIAHGATLVSKEQLLRDSDFITIHLVLSDRSRDLIDAKDFALMKKTARLINTSRGPIVNEAALLEAVTTQKIAGAAIDVYDVEPLPADHPFRRTANILATPHIGFVTLGIYRTFYGDTVTNVSNWLDKQQLDKQ
jgi:phosphoglycerate dehydrogenase-like enzyme